MEGILRHAKSRVLAQGTRADPNETDSRRSCDPAVWIHWGAAGAGSDRHIDYGKARAIQEAERARNELAMTQAEAAKKIAEAEGDAQSAINRAKGEVESNRIRLASLTPLLELRKLENQRALIEKCNGQLPTEDGGKRQRIAAATAEAVEQAENQGATALGCCPLFRLREGTAA